METESPSVIFFLIQDQFLTLNISNIKLILYENFKILYCRYSSKEELLSRKKKVIGSIPIIGTKVKYTRNYMIERNNISKKIFKFFLFVPLIFYYGKRSYIAFDEGVYALQALSLIHISEPTRPY